MEIAVWVFLGVMLVPLLPAYTLVKWYQRTKIVDCLILAGMFALLAATFLGSLQFPVDIQDYDNPSLFTLIIGVIWEGLGVSMDLGLLDAQLSFLFQQSWLFLLFLFAVRTRWDCSPKIIWYSGVVWFSYLTFLVLLWEPISEPARAMVLFWELPNRISPDGSDGYGLMTSGGVILYFTRYSLLLTLFAIFTFSLMLYATWSVRIVHPSNELIQARRMWIAAFGLGAIYFIGHLPWFPYIDWVDMSILVALMIIIGYNSYRTPESMFSSDAQVIRALRIYHQVHHLTKKEAVEKFGMPSVVEYFQSIQMDIIDRLNIKEEQRILERES
ncbi:MAG: hypothetical protein ACE5OZ_21215 [Candidatus Heimdallarchaeota archaeon]